MVRDKFTFYLMCSTQLCYKKDERLFFQRVGKHWKFSIFTPNSSALSRSLSTFLVEKVDTGVPGYTLVEKGRKISH